MWMDKVIGQEALKQQLKKTVETGRISHAQLFLGKPGTGALPLAIGYAQLLLCNASESQSSCNLKCDKLVHPDLHFAFPVNTTKKVKKDPVSSLFLEEFREEFIKNPYLNLFQWLTALGIENKQGLINTKQSSEILRDLTLKPYESEFKVMLIWQPERMNRSSANKLLKIIEEPPQKTVFLLVSEDQDNVLPTILSRTQLIRVPPLQQDDIKFALQEQYDLAEETASSIVSLADGSFNAALNILHASSEENFDQQSFINWMRMCYSKDFFKIDAWISDISRIGRERQKNFLAYGLHIYRECLISNYADPSLIRLQGAEQGFVNKFKPFINTANALQLIGEFEKAVNDIERNANPKILFLDLTVKVMKLLTLKP